MISYDVIGDYMSDLDDVRKRIEKRKRPLNDHNFKKLYNGMVRLIKYFLFKFWIFQNNQ